MDPKNRVSIHPDFRPPAGEKVYLLASESHEMPVLRVLGQGEYDRRVALVEEDTTMDPGDKQELLGIFASRCVEASINDQGKLQIPKEAIEETGIQVEGTIWEVGRQKYFEIWNEANYQEVRKIEKAVKSDRYGLFR